MYNKKGWITYLKNTDFFFFLIYLVFAHLSKPGMKSKDLGLLLGEGDASLLHTMAATGSFCTVLPAPLEMIGTEGLEQNKEGSICSRYSLMLIAAVQTASLVT